jgi:hypothetical protein
MKVTLISEKINKVVQDIITKKTEFLRNHTLLQAVYGVFALLLSAVQRGASGYGADCADALVACNAHVRQAVLSLFGMMRDAVESDGKEEVLKAFSSAELKTLTDFSGLILKVFLFFYSNECVVTLNLFVQNRVFPLKLVQIHKDML